MAVALGAGSVVCGVAAALYVCVYVKRELMCMYNTHSHTYTVSNKKSVCIHLLSVCVCVCARFQWRKFRGHIKGYMGCANFSLLAKPTNVFAKRKRCWQSSLESTRFNLQLSRINKLNASRQEQRQRPRCSPDGRSEHLN